MKKILFMCLVLLCFSLNNAIAQSIDQFRIVPDRTEGVAGIKIKNFNGSDSVIIPHEIKGIPVRVVGSGVFREKGIFTVTIPDSIVTIENDAFGDNLLTSLIIPNSVKFIGESAFRNNLLTNITISNGITSISNWAFKDNLLTSITIPDSVKYIGNGAFNDNPITSITIGANVRIGDSSFSGDFNKAYNNKAGTYTRPNINSKQWTRQ